MDRKQQGKKSRRDGKKFESAVRDDLEKKGWIVCRFDNQVNLELGILERSKGKFNPFTKMVMNMSSGFPDFICFFKTGTGNYKIRGVEAKMNGKLKKEEKEKCKWLLENKIFCEILIAEKVEKEIKYNFFGK
jgi:hypothetical protein